MPNTPPASRHHTNPHEDVMNFRTLETAAVTIRTVASQAIQLLFPPPEDGRRVSPPEPRQDLKPLWEPDHYTTEAEMVNNTLAYLSFQAAGHHHSYQAHFTRLTHAIEKLELRIHDLETQLLNVYGQAR